MNVDTIADIVFALITVAALVYIGLYGLRVIGNPINNDLKILNPNTTKAALNKEGRVNTRAAIVTIVWILCLIVWLIITDLS